MLCACIIFRNIVKINAKQSVKIGHADTDNLLWVLDLISIGLYFLKHGLILGLRSNGRYSCMATVIMANFFMWRCFIAHLYNDNKT